MINQLDSESSDGRSDCAVSLTAPLLIIENEKKTVLRKVFFDKES